MNEFDSLFSFPEISCVNIPDPYQCGWNGGKQIDAAAGRNISTRRLAVKKHI